MSQTKSFSGAPGKASPEYNPGRSGKDNHPSSGLKDFNGPRNNPKRGLGKPGTSFSTDKGGVLQSPPAGMMPKEA